MASPATEHQLLSRRWGAPLCPLAVASLGGILGVPGHHNPAPGPPDVPAGRRLVFLPKSFPGQHAITHGRAHVFEKWVGLQTRNRIINAVPVDEELTPVLASLYASPKRL